MQTYWTRGTRARPGLQAPFIIRVFRGTRMGLVGRLIAKSSIGSVLKIYSGVGPGYDYLRLGLALVIFNAHAMAIWHGRPGQTLLIAAQNSAKSSPAWMSWREPMYIL